MIIQDRIATHHFQAGRNCWRIEESRHVSFLIDGDAYFRAFRAAATHAQRSIMILGWDFDSRTRMIIDQHPEGKHAIQRLAGSQLHRLSRRMAQKGLIAVIIICLVPIAPFTIVNRVAKTSHIRFRDFALGTVLGELPGLLAISIFVNQISDTIRYTTITSIGMLAGIALFLFLGSIGLWRWLNRPHHSTYPLARRVG